MRSRGGSDVLMVVGQIDKYQAKGALKEIGMAKVGCKCEEIVGIDIKCSLLCRPWRWG